MGLGQGHQQKCVVPRHEPGKLLYVAEPRGSGQLCSHSTVSDMCQKELTWLRGPTPHPCHAHCEVRGRSQVFPALPSVAQSTTQQLPSQGLLDLPIPWVISRGLFVDTLTRRWGKRVSDRGGPGRMCPHCGDCELLAETLRGASGCLGRVGACEQGLGLEWKTELCCERWGGRRCWCRQAGSLGEVLRLRCCRAS